MLTWAVRFLWRRSSLICPAGRVRQSAASALAWPGPGVSAARVSAARAAGYGGRVAGGAGRVAGGAGRVAGGAGRVAGGAGRVAGGG
jgi:leader peptidase (prepilin peptidase) / N-methyltransferase